MPKCSRCEAVIFLLGGVACLGGCQTSAGFKRPTLPENCYWVQLPYGFFCLDLDVIIKKQVEIAKEVAPEVLDLPKDEPGVESSLPTNSLERLVPPLTDWSAAFPYGWEDLNSRLYPWTIRRL